MSFDKIEIIIFAFAGGLLPCLLWLWFWLKEDKKHPEPKHLIALAFLAGILIVIPVLKLEIMVYKAFTDPSMRIVLWAIIEELGKLIVAALVVLWRKEVDEPLDYTVYLITTALGFSAIETALFLTNSTVSSLSSSMILTGNLRFIGATLLHVSASAIIGIALGFGFYQRRNKKWIYLVIGIILSVALHAAFNLTIITSGGNNSLLVSSVIWAIVVALLLVLEKVKRLHPTNWKI